MYFHKTPGWLKVIYPDLIWGKKTEYGNTLFLTFDDGPVPEVTDFVLDILNKYKAKATFFCVGENMIKNALILEKIIEHGHSVGNHTQHHLNGWNSDKNLYLEDVAACDEILNKFLGSTRRKLFRPPYGRITKSQIKEIKKEHEIIMWDVLSGDFDQELQKEICLTKSINATTEGSIVVFHDSIKAEKNLNYVLPLYLEHFFKLNYKFLPL